MGKIVAIEYGDGYYITIANVVYGGQEEDFLTSVEISDDEFARDPCSCDICGTVTIAMYSGDNNMICGNCLDAAYLRINGHPLHPM